MKISKDKLTELIDDEQKGYEEYTKLGLNHLAKDEKKHKLFLEKMLRSC